jgi:hypothetical protein
MLTEKPSPTFKAHLDAIRNREVTKTNVIGIRKLLNGAVRRAEGWSVGMTTPLGSMAQANELLYELSRCKPTVVGDLHASGIKQLRNPRYAKRWGPVQSVVIDHLDHFKLIGFQQRGRYGQDAYPIYRAVSKPVGPDKVIRTFDFINIPWQSGGNGPEVLATSS